MQFQLPILSLMMKPNDNCSLETKKAEIMYSAAGLSKALIFIVVLPVVPLSGSQRLIDNSISFPA